jgi:hypothetical protein
MSGLWSGSPGLWSGNPGLWGGYTGLSGGGGLWGGGFSPATLFAAGEQGYWLDPSDFSTMFQDSAGTTPVTAVGQNVGRILDKSGRGNHFIQSSLASRPVLQVDIVRGLDLTPNYVIDAATGNDSNDGTSEGAAWKTLSKITNSILSAGKTTVVRIKSGTYSDALDRVIVANGALDSRLFLVFEPGCVMNGTAANALASTNGFEFNGTVRFFTTIYGNGLQVNSYKDAAGPTSPNGVGNRDSHVLECYDVYVDDCEDGFSSHGSATMRLYDCTAGNCTKAAYAHVDSCIVEAYRCTFTGRTGVTDIVISAALVTISLTDCKIIPATTGQTFDARRTTLTRCQVGTTILRVLISALTQSGTFTDCFVHAQFQANSLLSFSRCYGFMSVRQRNGGSVTVENCVITGPASGFAAVFYSDFNPGSGSPHIIRDNIFETATAAAFMSYDATNAGYVVAAGSQFWNNVLGGSAAFDADLIAADTGGTVIQNNITADPLIGAGNTLDPDDYGYGAGSPAIGAGVGGSNSGFAVGEVSAPVAIGTGAPRGPLFLLFDGSDDFLVSAATINPGAVDKAQVIAGVRKLSDVASGVVVESSTASSVANPGSFNITAPNSAAVTNYGFRSTGTVSVGINSGSTVFASPITNVLTLFGDISLDTLIGRVNGSQVNQSTADQGTGNYLTYLHYIGRRGGTSLPFNGRIYQMIARFGQNLDASTIAAAETFVNGKTGAY